MAAENKGRSDSSLLAVLGVGGAMVLCRSGAVGGGGGRCVGRHPA